MARNTSSRPVRGRRSVASRRPAPATRRVARLTITGLAVGGDGVARDADGRVVFVRGGVPGDVVEGRLVDERKRFARAELLVVVEPSPDRVTPPCPHVARGCGGCGWQHIELGAQREAKRRLVADALTRLGRLDARTSMPGRRGNHVEVTSGPALATQAFRTTVRCGVLDGRPALRRSRSHELVDVDGCPVAHPLLVELLAEARFPGAVEVTLRCGARTGERLVLVQPSLAGGAAGVVVPSDVIVAGPDRPAADHEEAAARRWRISGTSFFQSRADGADLLVARVRELLGPEPGRVLDAYCGVGLLGAAAPGAELIAVEAHPAAVADARVNLAWRGATVVESPVERWRPCPVDSAIADPARHGLGAAGADVLAGTGAATVVLVSCDAGSLGRDAGLLGERGYDLDHCEVLDLFPHTPHVEVVSRFRRR